MENGDEITIDVKKRSITLHVEDAVLEKRRENWKPVEKTLMPGYLNVYRRTSRSAAQGAVVE